MRYRLWQLIICLVTTAAVQLLLTGEAAAKCTGRFINPVSDICWRCAFPMRLGNKIIFDKENQGDNDSSAVNDGNFICNCGVEWIGAPVGYWEPNMVVDVSTDPHCIPSLDGMTLDIDLPADGRGAVAKNPGRTGQQSFYHYTMFRNPIMVAMGWVSDNPCVEHLPFDAIDFSMANPAWTDDSLSAILSPDAFLYGSLPAVLAGIPHCAASTAGTNDPASMWIRRTAHWSNGCNGKTYPLTGKNASHLSALSTSHLIAKRAFAIQHRTMRVWNGAGGDGMCGPYPKIFMDDTDYKISMLNPLPQTNPIFGRCCQGFGASTLVWGAGHSWPVTGEDFSYMVFRKRDCCMSGGGVK